MKKALILCNDFPPLNSIGAERPYSWYQYFKKYGIEVTVVTKDWQSPSSAVENLVYDSPNQRDSKIEITETGRIIRVPHQLTLPDKIVLKNGMQKSVFQRRAMTLLYKLLSFVFLKFDKHAYIYREAERLLLNESFDFVITTGEPFVLFRYGFLLKKRFRFLWLADYRDGWWLNHETSQRKSFLSKAMRRYELFFEKMFIKSADFIQSVDPLISDSLSKLHDGKKAFCVYNGFRNFYTPIHTSGTDTKLLLTHTGTLTTGQEIEFLLDVIIHLHQEGKIKPGDLELRMVGLQFYQAQHSRVINYSTLIKDYVITTPRLPREKALEMNHESDYCIALTDPDYKAIYAKTYDYIACETPILIIPNDHSLLENITLQLNAGKAFDSKEELKDFLSDCIIRKKSGQSIEKLRIDRNKAWFYSRENQTKLMAGNLLGLIANS